ncbi:hypothetical protein ScPMuIL_002813 [Solemya velum]
MSAVYQEQVVELRNNQWSDITHDESIPTNNCGTTATDMNLVGTDWGFDLPKSGPAIEIGKAKFLDILGDRLNITFIDAYKKNNLYECTVQGFGSIAAKLYHEDGVNGFFGPGCSVALDAVAHMAADWNTPVLTPAGTSESLSDKNVFSTLTRMSVTYNMFSEFHGLSLLHFNWTDAAYIYDFTDYSSMFKAEDTAATLANSKITLTLVRYDPELGENARRQALVEASRVARGMFKVSRGMFRVSCGMFKVSRGIFRVSRGVFKVLRDMFKALRGVFKVSRVFFVACGSVDFRELMLTAQEMGKTNGEYVFIVTQFFQGDSLGGFSWKYNYADDEVARKAFESVLMVQVRVPPGEEFHAFNDEVKAASLRDYNFDWGDQPVTVMVSSFVDGMLLYANALNETLNAGEDPLDGRNVQGRLWGRDFKGVAGHVAINAVGDRRTDFSLMDLTDPYSPEFKEVAYYDGYSDKFINVEGAKIHWPNDRGPPPNRPVCGFLGDAPECQTYEFPMVAILGTIFASVLLIIGCVGACIYRKFRKEAELHGLWWKVKWEDIISSDSRSKSSSCQSTLQSDMMDNKSRRTQIFANTGVYKGVTVVIRKVNTKHPYIDHGTIKEMKQMRDVTSGHLTKFYGLCPDEPNICELIEYCTRGSLQDILSNDSIKLDRDFKISLVNDMMEGMSYIHNGNIKLHGRLNSSNCVIDSRFALKITDFGMFSLRRQETHSESKRKNLLWVAPEHLRTDPYTDFSQAGDIYSFGIVLSEVLTRNEPFDNEIEELDLNDILVTLRKGKKPPLRPTCSALIELEEPRIVKIMQLCWDEDYMKRPSFQEIRRQLKDAKWKLVGGNVVDTMMNRMEQYANNLEGLVEERTQAFLDEKRKSEALLYHILPRSVAEKLKNGIVMEPEAFESVTVYFSDIIGFTNISARSTPMQVIDFLNDLYTCFDSIIDSFDVYKVETIGDAYMVVSGLPIRNGNEHAPQIARMSLSILSNLSQFKLRHDPETVIRVRIGLHSGPVCAGVVGTKMPRYCLFGDTVNTASRMESNGEALKIHASQSTKELLHEFGTFEIENRGEIFIKVGTDWPFDIPRTGPAIEIGNDMFQDIIGNRINVTFIEVYKKLKYRECTTKTFGSLAARLYYEDGVNGLFGRGCGRANVVVRQMAADLGIPMITPVGPSGTLSDETDFNNKMLTEFTPIIVASQAGFFRDLMLTAHRIGKTNSEYVYFIARLFDGDTTGDFTWKTIVGGNVVDTMMRRMEQYADNLEGLVEERTQAFLDEKQKSEELLYHILPRHVADKLKNGIMIEPEAFESVTIYFSDIIGFARSTPMQVIDFLNDLYTCFVSIIGNFDVYKVETVGDAYMVVVGLPLGNGTEHATQVARMSLSILSNLRQFKLRHEPGTAIKVRIGLHSGPVCAGVVGTKMPRYCLFGDTVNTASRMESNGEGKRGHMAYINARYLRIPRHHTKIYDVTTQECMTSPHMNICIIIQEYMTPSHNDALAISTVDSS